PAYPRSSPLHCSAVAAIYTLSLHDALPISRALLHPVRRLAADRRARGGGRDGAARAPSTRGEPDRGRADARRPRGGDPGAARRRDRKSTRLNSSHVAISYAVFCLKKKTATQ